MSLVNTKCRRVRGLKSSRMVSKKKTRTSHYSKFGPRHYGPVRAPDKIDDFTIYSSPDDEEEEEEFAAAMAVNGIDVPRPLRTARQNQQWSELSYNITDFLMARSIGNHTRNAGHYNEEYGTRHMLITGMFREYPVSLMSSSSPSDSHAPLLQHQMHNNSAIVDKVFSSQWINSHRVVMGTKCNKIKIYDITKHRVLDIPTLADSSDTPTGHGVYTMEVNPSNTMLCTVGRSGRDIAVYQISSMRPLCLGNNGHTDGILDTCWLDDEFVVSVGIDKKIALWRIEKDYYDSLAATPPSFECSDDIIAFDDRGQELVPNQQNTPDKKIPAAYPMRIKRCTGADKLRGVIFNRNKGEIVTLSTNAFIHVWDCEKFKQIMSRKLPHAMENVCLTQKQDCSLYAVGSKSHFTLLDPRTLNHVKKVTARINTMSVKSLSFNQEILTIGTAAGQILFYDMRAGKYMESTMNSGRAVLLKCSRGFVHMEEAALEMMQNPNVQYSPTIYTHCYDHSGTRIFAAGGPLSVSIRGHYAALWR